MSLVFAVASADFSWTARLYRAGAEVRRVCVGRYLSVGSRLGSETRTQTLARFEFTVFSVLSLHSYCGTRFQADFNTFARSPQSILRISIVSLVRSVHTSVGRTP